MTNSINWRAIFYINGLLLVALAFMMIIPALCDLLFFNTQNVRGFYIGFFICLVAGGCAVLANWHIQKMALGMREAFLITTLVWIVSSIFTAIPFLLTIKDITFFDACFESISAITTTGASLFVKPEALSRPILLWRSMLQWLGGIGIIVIAMSFFPVLRLGGMQLFRSEFSDRSEKILPRLSQISISLLSFYIGFTLVCAILYNYCGMGTFDSICHALCTISTGGLSTRSENLKYFNSGYIESISCFFMIIGSTTLVLFIRMIYGDWKVVFKDSQLKVFLTIIFILGSCITFWLFQVDHYSFLDSSRYSFFMIISMITTTGFTNTTSVNWHPFAQQIFFVLILIGGCTGSTTGGIKIFRLQVLATIARNHMRQLRRPNAVLIPKFQGYKITQNIAFSVLTLISLYLLVLLISSILLSACGIDFSTALSCAGGVLGNAGNYVDFLISNSKDGLNFLTTFPKLILMFGMICGRLELLTVIILFMPSFWRS